MRAVLLLLLVPCLSTVNAAPRLSAEVILFDPGLGGESAGQADVFPAIREVEALLWSYRLSRVLLDDDFFDVVRLQKRSDLLSDFAFSGRILHSDGFEFSLALTARDASGRVWLEQTVSGQAGAPDRALITFRDAMHERLRDASASKLARIRELSLLRYGARIAPSVFKDYLAVDEAGLLQLKRLPAKGDPMVERLARVREATYLISDAIDEKFAGLSEQVDDVYAAWRDYRKQNRIYQQENLRRGSVGLGDFERGSYEAYKRIYDLYKWDRETAQEQDRLAVAFGNEVGPAIMAIDERVAELLTWVDAKNAEWYRLLEALFDVETRIEQLPPPGAERRP